MKYYVYIYTDPRKPGDYTYRCNNDDFHFSYEPFYVGKGCFKRYRDHLNPSRLSSRTNPHKENTIKRIMSDTGKRPFIEIVKKFFDEDDALLFEKSLISVIGRYLNGGILTNICEGGENGRTGLQNSPEHRQKISNALKGRLLSDEHRKRIGEAGKGRKMPQSHIDSARKRMLETQSGEGNYRWGKKDSLEVCEKRRISHNNYVYELIAPDGHEYSDILDIKGFCDIHNLNYRALKEAIRIGRKYHKNWKVSRRLKF
jgi:hypothetical protein